MNGEHDDAEQVTLELPSAAGATTSVAVAGDFNDWSVTSHVMRQREDGGFEITFEVPRGRVYGYRYWVDDERWENDWAADAYLPNAYGGENSVLDLRPESSRVGAAAPTDPPPAVGDGVVAEGDSIERPPDEVKSAADGAPTARPELHSSATS